MKKKNKYSYIFKVPVRSKDYEYCIEKFYTLFRDGQIINYISAIKVYWIGINKRLVQITCTKPGLVVGKKGESIKRLNSFLEIELGKDIVINIKLNKLWKR